MSWVRLDDQFADHPKLKGVGPLGLALQTMAICYAARYGTDGKLNFAIAESLVRQLSDPWTDSDGKRWQSAVTSAHAGRDAHEFPWIDIMVDAGLWEEVEGGYIIHDFDKYNPPSQRRKTSPEELRNVRSEAGKRGAQARWRDGKPMANANSKSSQEPMASDGKNMPPVPVPLRDPKAEKEESKDLSGSAREAPPRVSSPPRKDPTMAALRGELPHQREDVARVVARFAELAKLPKVVLGGWNDPRAVTVAESIDAFGEEACVQILDEAVHDDTVNGRGDAAGGSEHWTLEYIFRPTTRERLYKAAQERTKRAARAARRAPASEPPREERDSGTIPKAELATLAAGIGRRL